MRIQVVADDRCGGPQARTYAEYRVFAALARHTPRVRGARVVLRHAERQGAPWVVCDVTVALEPSGAVRTQAGGSHAYAAINRLVDRIGELMERDPATLASAGD
jgi:ribosome-associated translation inhibitor RaiA